MLVLRLMTLVPRIKKTSDAMRAAGELRHTQTIERAAALILAIVSAVLWFDAASHHYKTGAHVLLLIDVLMPPFGIVVGALRLAGLV